MFSTTGLICNKKRSRLTNSHIEDLALINLNHRKLKKILIHHKIEEREEINTKLIACGVDSEICLNEDEEDSLRVEGEEESELESDDDN